MKELYELKDMLCEELEKYGKKGDLSTGSLEVVQKLASAVNNLCKIIESCESEEYSGAMNKSSYRGRSYAQRRDRMGRYSRMDGYSRHEDMIGELRYLMQNADDDRTRMEFQRFIDKMEQM